MSAVARAPPSSIRMSTASGAAFARDAPSPARDDDSHDDRDDHASLELCRRSGERLGLWDPHLGRGCGRLGGELLARTGGALPAALTVAILAAPTRGQALDKATFRLARRRAIGVAAAIAITALFSQTRDLLLAAFAGWIGALRRLRSRTHGWEPRLRGGALRLHAWRSSPSSSSIRPQHVFESSVARGAAIAVGIAAVALVNDVLAAPDSFPQAGFPVGRPPSSRSRLCEGPFPAMRRPTRRPPRGSCATSWRSAPRSQVLADRVQRAARSGARRPEARPSRSWRRSHAARAMNALRAAADPAFGDMSAATLEGSGKPSPAAGVIGSPLLAAPAGLLLQAFLRRDAEVREALTALNAGRQLDRGEWRLAALSIATIAAAAGLRAAAYLVLRIRLLRPGRLARGRRLPLAGRPRDWVGRDDARSTRLHRLSIYRGSDRSCSGGYARISDSRRRQRISVARACSRALHDRHDGADDPAASPSSRRSAAST